MFPLYTHFSPLNVWRQSLAELEELYSTVQQTIRSLEMLGQPVRHWDSVLIYSTTRCFDPNIIKAWELHLGPCVEYPKWDQLSQFIVSRLRSLQALERTSSSTHTFHPKSEVNAQRPSPGTRPSKSHLIQPIRPPIKNCIIC